MKTRKWLNEYRYVPVKVRTGLFSSRVVVAVQRKFVEEELVNGPDPVDSDPTVNKLYGWDFVCSVDDIVRGGE